MSKPTYRFRFSTTEKASKFKSFVDVSCGNRVRVKNPYTGKGVEVDPKLVFVTGTGSAIFDMVLKDQCERECDRLGGIFVG